MSECLAKSLVPQESSDAHANKRNIPSMTSVPMENANVAPIDEIDWLEINDNQISDNQLLDVLNQIENANANQPVSEPKTTNNINVNSVSNIQTIPNFPGMYFPGSTVTINFNNYSK